MCFIQQRMISKGVVKFLSFQSAAHVFASCISNPDVTINNISDYSVL